MLLKVLTYNGQADLAYEVMNQKIFPVTAIISLAKMLHTLGKLGRTVLIPSDVWQRGCMVFTTLAGISPDPLIRGTDFVINPFTDNELSFASASYHSVYRMRSSAWKKKEYFDFNYRNIG